MLLSSRRLLLTPILHPASSVFDAFLRNQEPSNHSHEAPTAASTDSAPHAFMQRQQRRPMSSNPITDALSGARQAMQLPPNPFRDRPHREHGPKMVLYRGPGMLVFRCAFAAP